MSPQATYEYVQALRPLYKQAGKKERGQMLTDMCQLCGFNRKYAIRLLNRGDTPSTSRPARRTGRPRLYDHPDVLAFLLSLSAFSNHVCAKRLHAMIPLWLPFYRPPKGKRLFDAARELLTKISPATIDRLLSNERQRFVKRGLVTTKPGSIIRDMIPVNTRQWNETRPGFVEADTVAHCGDSMAGMFAYTVNFVDIATGWTEQCAVWGKGERGVCQALDQMEQALPFKLLGFDCDNGSEFLNNHLLKFYLDRRPPVCYTRSRPYHKNDNAHIEQKNWTLVRQYLGYARFDSHEIIEAMNDLYRNEFRLFHNCFLPSVKLKAKVRIGSTIHKTHDAPQTPLQRVLAHPAVPAANKKMLRELVATLNPYDLQKSILQKVNRILRLANQ